MRFLFLYLFDILLECYKAQSFDDSLGQHCRDSENKPVKWWYIYKPPADVIPPYTGLNFSFLTPNTNGLWLQSNVDITDSNHNMISNTLIPTYKQRTYKNKIGRAVVTFGSRSGGGSRTSARGVVMAGGDGGFLLTHTVPGFPGKFNSQPLFPLGELENGHLLACLSLKFDALNKVARAINEISPNITFAYVPDTLSDMLPQWDFEKPAPSLSHDRLRSSIYFLVQTVQADPSGVAAALVARPPGVKSCIYSSFAAKQLVMLNVYGQSRSSYLTTACGDGFGVRNLESLCLKYQGPEANYVYYVTNSTDYSWFAVSTAAYWQQRGSGPRQFWVCTSLVDKEDLSGEGGLLLCLQNYNLWVAFDNLKVAEPLCE